jgi:hypothetical protein
MTEAQAYNLSIYLMVAAPYLLIGAVGFAVYRVRRKAELQSNRDADRPDEPGGPPCPTSRGDDS